MRRTPDQSTPVPQRARGVLRRLGSAVATLALIASGTLIGGASATASTVYEIQGRWVDDPVPASVHTTQALESEWHFNVNDSQAAPGNEPVDNVTITFVVTNGLFRSLPDVCLASGGVTPVSSISEDGRTLVCNVGTRPQGASEMIRLGIEVAGSNGDTVAISGEIGGVAAELPEIPVENAFAMDLKFDQGNPFSAGVGNSEVIDFPWSLRHAPGSAEGPASVSYDLTLSNTVGSTIAPHADGCVTLSNPHPGHPFSDTGRPDSATAPFPECTLTSTGRNTMTLTLSGLDYSKSLLPTIDSRGRPLEHGWDVIASGRAKVAFAFSSGTTTTITASTPTYHAVSGETSVDDPSNNSNTAASLRGTFTGGWILNHLTPPVQGAQWADTFRTMAGQPVRSTSGVRTPVVGQSDATEACTVLDSRFVTFTGAALRATLVSGETDVVNGIVYWYYTGSGVNNNLDPAHANYDPNAFRCAGTSGWSMMPPADLSTVRAVKATILPSVGATIATAVPTMHVDGILHNDVPVGQDVWVWTSQNFGASSGGWTESDRSLAPSAVTTWGVLTPGSRYPFTGAGRDVIRIIGATPVIQKSVDQDIIVPGATVDYTLTYRAEASEESVIDAMTVTDQLPEGMVYVPGSANPAPSSISGQKLEWAFTRVASHTDHVITFSARAPADAVGGDVFKNTATAKIADRSATDTATTQIRDGGQTMLTKTAENAVVTHTGGVAEGAWTVRMTSMDTHPQAFADAIDVLPFNGDGRGTSFSGSYQLTGPIEPVGTATVYYSTADPATLTDDPAHPSNGRAGSIAGNTVGWSTTFDADATAVRVVTSGLAPFESKEFVIRVVTAGAAANDVYVNRAEARSERTQLVMRTSSRFEIGGTRSVDLKKWVQDTDGEWRDANDIDDFPEFQVGATLRYRIVIVNTGDEILRNLVLNDDKVTLEEMDPLPDGLGSGAIIAELLPGVENAVTVEYEVPLTQTPVGGQLVNTACVEGESLEPSCDPAGVWVLPSSLAWVKVASGSLVALEGSEWELTPVDEDGKPTGVSMNIIDCVAASAGDCDGPDTDPAAGAFRIGPLEEGRYRLVETKAPAGYTLDATPRYITVRGDTRFDLPIENEMTDGLTIPLTGGMGSLSFWVAASVLGGLGAAGFVWQRHRRRPVATAV